MLCVKEVERLSPAAKGGIKAQDVILKINGEEALDIIDFHALTADEKVHMLISRQGKNISLSVDNPSYEPLGIRLTQSALPPPNSCANNCIFCFVAQMPEGMRHSLYIKDDDWRYSLMMGNFITLTNVSDNEFERIIKRKASPLYISVHATSPIIRQNMMKNKNAGKLMERLIELKNNGISYHLQIVLVPGVNDGDVLKQSLSDLYALLPNALSVALVPVGLTKFREGLYPIESYDKSKAKEVLDIASCFQDKAKREHNISFVHPSDEFYCIAEENIPPASFYDGFPQIENGVGMIRQFEDELISSKEYYDTTLNTKHKILIPCGTMIYPLMKEWVEKYSPENVTATVIPIKNRFFGETVTVTGLITASDLLHELKGMDVDMVLIADSMLDSSNELFLDNISFDDFKHRLKLPCKIVSATGEGLYKALNVKE